MLISIPVILESKYKLDRNAFDIFRLLLAIGVIYSHSYPLVYGATEGFDLLARISKGQLDVGALAVNGFFVISGFLITQSMCNTHSHFQYFLKRGLRIFPALICSLALVSFVIGPFVSSLNPREYFTDSGDGPFSFFFKNITFGFHSEAWGIHDVFSENPFPFSVNGSIWTLKYEVICYFGVALLSYLSLLRYRLLTLCMTILIGLFYYFNICFQFEQNLSNLIRLSLYFFSGSLYYLYRDKVLLDIKWAVASTLILIAAICTSGLNIVLPLLLPYLLIYLCVSVQCISIKKIGDLSYGMYIYAFPVQQLLVAYGKPFLNATELFILSLVFVFLISWVSWRYIEKPCLRLKKYLQRKSVRSSYTV